MKSKTFSFKNAKGVKYVVKERKIQKKHDSVGLCYPPFNPRPRIYLDPDISDRLRLSTIIEEFLHAFFWSKSEREIKKAAQTIAKFLYADNWRRDY